MNRIIDRESVVSHLQIMHTWAAFALKKDMDFFEEAHIKNIAEWTMDAIVLLKEPVKPSRIGNMLKCGKCGAHVGIYGDDVIDSYCRKCGMKVGAVG